MVTNDLDGKPFQLKFVRPAQMMLFANVICDPPFGQVTVVPFNQQIVNFTVLIESSKSFPEQGWEATLWHNCHKSQEWHELSLQEIPRNGSIELLALSSKGRASNVYRRYFSIGLHRPQAPQDIVRFTLKFRTSSNDPWRWVNSQSSLQDGELYFQSLNPPPDLTSYLQGTSADLTVESIPSEAIDTCLWSVTARVQSAQEKNSGYLNISLGTPCSFTRWFALVRIWSPWLAPRHGQGNFCPSEDAILCSFLRWDGLHLVLLAVSGVDDVLTVMKPDGQGNVLVSGRNDSLKEGQARILAAVGQTFEAANAAVMYHARKLVQSHVYIEDRDAETRVAKGNEVKADWMENWYDGFTYCTWNGLGQDLNENKILDALDVLKDNDIMITNLIIDDNWQSLDNEGQSQFKRGMTDFDANKESFPQGLKHTVTQIRQKHTNIEHIGVWHALLGYWGGISPTGNIAKKYKIQEVRKRDGFVGDTMTVVDADDAQLLYNDFYMFLRDAGVDSVKTDAQFFIDILDDADDRKRYIKAYQDAWAISSLRYFSTKSISCMSQIPQIIFHSQLPTNKPRLMVRNSDDFFPEIVASHPWHIFTNAHNSLLTSHLNILPDWDMFQTSHPYSSFHAAGRCISGGPVYFTDEPGKHDIDLIAQMTARTTLGKTVILRPTVIGKTTSIYTAYEEDRLLRVGTFSGGRGTGTGILGIFNISQRPLSEFVNLNGFPGVEAGEQYIIRGHTTGEISHAIRLDETNAVISLEVDVKGWEILSAYHLNSFTIKGTQDRQPWTISIAILGLLGKMTGAAAVLNSEMRVDAKGRLHVSTSIKALGILGIYMTDLADRTVEETILITILGKGIPRHTVSSDVSNLVLKVDIERAWNEMGLQGGWSNEVPMEIFIR